MEDYRVYFDVKMLDDALLKTYVTPNIVKESSQYVESIARGLGVEASAIATPTPFLVSQLALFWAYMTAAWRKASMSIGKSADEDSFALKYKIFYKMLNDLLDTMTAETFTNGKPARKRIFPSTMEISRS